MHGLKQPLREGLDWSFSYAVKEIQHICFMESKVQHISFSFNYVMEVFFDETD